MKPGIAIVFLLLWIVAMLRPIAPLIEYAANTGYFAEVLCVNKDKPELGCNGKCALMQRLKLALGEPLEPAPFKPIQSINLKDYPVGLVSLVAIPHNNFTVLKTNPYGPLIIEPVPPVLEFIQPPS